jgi:hypothetical protein
MDLGGLGLGFGVYSSGLRSQGFGLRVIEGLGFRL